MNPPIASNGRRIKTVRPTGIANAYQHLTAALPWPSFKPHVTPIQRLRREKFPGASICHHANDGLQRGGRRFKSHTAVEQMPLQSAHQVVTRSGLTGQRTKYKCRRLSRGNWPVCVLGAKTVDCILERDGVFCARHDTYRHVSSKPSLNPRIPKSTVPKTISKLPSLGSSSTTPRSNVPSPYTLNSRSLPGRSNGRSDNKEAMILGVVESDRRRADETRERDAAIRKWRQKLTLIENGIIDIATNTQNAKSNIRKDLTEAKMFGKADYRCRYHPRVVFKLDVHEQNITQMSVTLSSIEKCLRRASANVIVAQKIAPLESRLYDVEELVIRALSNYRQEMEKASSEKPAVSLSVSEQVSAAIAVQSHLKGERARHSKLWTGIKDLAYTINRIMVSLELLYHKHENSARSNSQTLTKALSTARHLTALNKRFRSLSRNDQPTEHDWDANVSLLAHNVREIELNIRQAEYIPEATFAQRWVESLKFRLVVPIKDFVGFCRTELLQRQYVLTANQLAKRHDKLWAAKLVALASKFDHYLAKSDKITEMYLYIMQDGMVSSCPHPMPDLFRAQVRALMPFKRYNNNWHSMLTAMREVHFIISKEERKPDIYFDAKRIGLREAVVEQIKLFTLDQDEQDHALSRRGNLSDLRNFTILNTARLQLFGVRTNNHILADANDSAEYSPSDREKLVPPFKTTNQIINNTLPANWLSNKTLYPRQAPVLIDYVISIETLEQVFQEISKQQAIGLDITIDPQAVHVTFGISHITFSSESNIYILDLRFLRSLNSRYFFNYLNSVLEDESIVKICVDSAATEGELWTCLGSDLRNAYDLRSRAEDHDLQQPDLLTSMLQRTFGLKGNLREAGHLDMDLFDAKYSVSTFRDLAIRAYASLQLFHSLHSENDKNVTNSQDTYLVTQYRMPQYQNLHETELGPVMFDRCQSPYRQSDLVRGFNRASRHRRSFRKTWMRDLAYNTASLTLKRTKLKKDMSKHDAIKAVAAYHLATSFGETLRTIETYLNLPGAAKTILWAAKEFNLRFDPEDQAKYEQVVRIREQKVSSRAEAQRLSEKAAKSIKHKELDEKSQVEQNFVTSKKDYEKQSERPEQQTPPPTMSRKKSKRIRGSKKAAASHERPIPTTRSIRIEPSTSEKTSVIRKAQNSLEKSVTKKVSISKDDGSVKRIHNLTLDENFMVDLKKAFAEVDDISKKKRRPRVRRVNAETPNFKVSRLRIKKVRVAPQVRFLSIGKFNCHK